MSCIFAEGYREDKEVTTRIKRNSIPRKFSDNNTKICSFCRKEKSRSDYYCTYKDGVEIPSSRCKECSHLERKKHIAKDPKSYSLKLEKYRKEHREHLNELHKLAARRNHEKVINFYGGKCACCGESRFEFLALDHINGDGGKLRKNGIHPKTGKGLYAWIIRNNYPDIFQLLCHNCNFAKGAYGACPHEQERQNASG